MSPSLPALLAKDDWLSYLAGAGVDAQTRTLIVAQPSYFDGIGGMLRDVPLATWQAYLTYNLLSAYSPYLSAAFVAEDFAFEQHTLRGVPEIQPRWKRAVVTGRSLAQLCAGPALRRTLLSARRQDQGRCDDRAT